MIEERPMADQSEYRWQGRVIKLTLKDYAEWKQSFHHIDLDAALLARDIELSEPGLDEKERKRWFFSTAMWLYAMHQNQARMTALAEKRDKKRADPNRRDPFFSQYQKQYDDEGF
jgi:hypothetical protein